MNVSAAKYMRIKSTGVRLMSKGLKMPGMASKRLQVKRKRRKSGEITLLKKKLWKLLREAAIKKYGRVCFTCGRKPLEGGNCQLGHFITSSTCSIELRFDPKHLRIQCYHCNINLSGNWVAFEKALKAEGVDTEELKARNEATKGTVYPVQWFQDKIKEYESILNTV